MVSRKDIQDLKDRIVIRRGLHKECLWVVNGSPEEFIAKLNSLIKPKGKNQ